MIGGSNYNIHQYLSYPNLLLTNMEQPNNNNPLNDLVDFSITLSNLGYLCNHELNFSTISRLFWIFRYFLLSAFIFLNSILFLVLRRARTSFAGFSALLVDPRTRLCRFWINVYLHL